MGFCTTRSMATALVTAAALALTACGSEPGTFDPAATSSDVNAMTGAFESPVIQSFAAAAGSVDAVTAARAGFTVGQLQSATSRSRDAARYISRVRSVLGTPAAGLSASSASIPPEALGKTFVYNTAEDRYVASDRAGAPGDGVRLVLYAVNPVTGQIAEPLNEIGYADVVVDEGSSSLSAQVTVVSGGITYLDYEVEVSGSGSGGRILVDGFITNGVDRADFRLDNTVAFSGDMSGQFTLDYSIEVPSRDLSFDFDMTIEGDGVTGDGTITLSLELSGPNGRVDLAGNYSTAAAGTLDVDVNGDDFASINITAESTTETTIEIVGANGNALTEAEREALENIFDAFEDGFDVFEDLLRPIGM